MALVLPDFPIHAFIGANGTGKTYGAVHLFARSHWDQGKPVCSNLRLYPENAGYPADLYVPLTSWRLISSFRDGGLLLDEISSVLPSREASSVPPDLMRRLNQLRKADVRVAWTAPSWARCDKALREVTQAVTVCRARMLDRWERQPGTYSRTTPSGRRLRTPEQPGGVRARVGWEPRRWFTWTTYDAQEFDEFTFAAVKGVKPRHVAHHWRPKHNTQDLYRTLEEVMLMDHLDARGVCVACGGVKTPKKCGCGDPTETVPQHRSRGPVKTPAQRREATL